MKESIFKTTKSNIEIFRQMVEQSKKRHEDTLSSYKKNYRGELLEKVQKEEKEHYNQSLLKLRQDVFESICAEINILRNQIVEKTEKKDFKALQEIIALSSFRLNQSEFDLLCSSFNTNNYWIAKKLFELSADQGLELPFAFCPIENQFTALDELKENCHYFIFGTDDEKGETFNRYGKNQQFGGFGDTEGKPNTYEQFYLVSDSEFSRLENLYENNNVIFSEDQFIDDLIKDLLSHEKNVEKIHFLDNKMKKMTKRQQEELLSKMSENEDLRLISQLFTKIQSDQEKMEEK